MFIFLYFVFQNAAKSVSQWLNFKSLCCAKLPFPASSGSNFSLFVVSYLNDISPRLLRTPGVSPALWTLIAAISLKLFFQCFFCFVLPTDNGFNHSLTAWPGSVWNIICLCYQYVFASIEKLNTTAYFCFYFLKEISLFCQGNKLKLLHQSNIRLFNSVTKTNIINKVIMLPLCEAFIKFPPLLHQFFSSQTFLVHLETFLNSSCRKHLCRQAASPAGGRHPGVTGSACTVGAVICGDSGL